MCILIGLQSLAGLLSWFDAVKAAVMSGRSMFTTHHSSPHPTSSGTNTSPGTPLPYLAMVCCKTDKAESSVAAEDHLRVAQQLGMFRWVAFSWFNS